MRYAIITFALLAGCTLKHDWQHVDATSPIVVYTGHAEQYSSVAEESTKQLATDTGFNVVATAQPVHCSANVILLKPYVTNVSVSRPVHEGECAVLHVSDDMDSDLMTTIIKDYIDWNSK